MQGGRSRGILLAEGGSLGNQDRHGHGGQEVAGDASGRVCARCGKGIRPGEDVRRTASGSFQHELCGLF
jgi:hypothetical protein